MRFDVIVVGGGTAGCVLAARLSEERDRRVCLLEAGPDYGPLGESRWPPEILDARALPDTHDWGPGGEDGRSLGGRLLGGSSSVNACMIVAGSPEDYDEWGPEWSYTRFLPYLARAKSMLRTEPANTERPASFHLAYIEAAVQAGFPLLSDFDDPARPIGVGPFPANVVDGRRWNAAFAYLEPALGRPNLVIAGDTLVDRVLLDGTRAVGVVDTNGRRFEAETVLLTAGAYFSPAILIRTGIGPDDELSRLGIPVVSNVPAGMRLLDHCGTAVSWNPSARLHAETSAHERETGLFEPHVLLKAASSSCPPSTWDLHLLSWIYPAGNPGPYEASAIVFHMKPLSTGRVRLRSADPTEAPLVERGFLSSEDDVPPLLEGIELARTLAATGPLRDLLAREVRPGDFEPERYTRNTVRSYFHPAGTCGVGAVVDAHGRVLGTENLLVADASIMPTIPRANTNLTTAAIAERIAASFD